MAEFSGTSNEKLHLNTSLQNARDFFTDPGKFKEALPALDHAEEMEPNLWKWTLKEMSAKGVGFQGVYTVRYEPTEHGLTWKTVEGNMSSEGHLSLKGLGDSDQGVELHYTETISLDLPVPKLLAKVLHSMVAKMIKKGIDGFLEKSKKLVEQ